MITIKSSKFLPRIEELIFVDGNLYKVQQIVHNYSILDENDKFFPYKYVADSNRPIVFVSPSNEINVHHLEELL